MKQIELQELILKLKRIGGSTYLQRVALALTIADAAAVRFRKITNLEDDYTKLRGRTDFEAAVKKTFKTAGVKKHYSSSSNFKDAGKGIKEFLVVSKAAKASGLVACGEVSAWVYCKLYQIQFVPFEHITLTQIGQPYDSHAFVAMGLPPGLYFDDLSHHKESDAVICDPWGAVWLKVNKGTVTNGVYSVPEYIKLFEDMLYDKTSAIAWQIIRDYRVGD